MPLKELLLAAALCAALATGAGRIPSRAASPAAPNQATQKPEPTSPEGGAKSQRDGAESQPAKAESKPADAKPKADGARPKVTEIKEDGLRSLLGAGGERARPLLVNFWATWCGPCREEFPDLVRIRKQYAADRLDFVLVSLDDPSDIEKAVPDFLTEVRATAFPSYLLHADDDGAAINYVDPTWSGELPATFLYDRTGALVFKHKGRVHAAELRAALERALSAKPQAASTQK